MSAELLPMPWRYHDGGRADAGFVGQAGDCFVRAVAIASGRPYREVYREVAAANAAAGQRRSARDGVSTEVARRYMDEQGWEWVPTMQVGSGCRVHLAAGELPDNRRLVVRLSRHFVAVVDGEVLDTYDPGRDGTRCVYGYWRARWWP